MNQLQETQDSIHPIKDLAFRELLANQPQNVEGDAATQSDAAFDAVSALQRVAGSTIQVPKEYK